VNVSFLIVANKVGIWCLRNAIQVELRLNVYDSDYQEDHPHVVLVISQQTHRLSHLLLNITAIWLIPNCR